MSMARIPQRSALVWLAAVSWCLAACTGADDGGGSSVDGGDIDVPPPVDAAPPDVWTEPELLSQTGLYADIASGTLAPGVLEYQPIYELWSDTARKRRWLLLPPDTAIDTSDMDHWVFPVGTKVFKEFVRDDVLVETRMIWRIGEGPDDYFMGAFLWELDGSDAVFVPNGARNANGTTHDVPQDRRCWDCHQGEPGRILGFSAIQLSDPVAETNLTTLTADGLLSAPPLPDELYHIPGNEVEVAALGYMHANCGNCHNPHGKAFEDADVIYRLGVDEHVPAETEVYTTNLNILLEHWELPPYTTRIIPGDPASSAVVARMNTRGAGLDQMPPLATEEVDVDGLDAVSTWIEQLPTSIAPESRPK